MSRRAVLLIAAPALLHGCAAPGPSTPRAAPQPAPSVMSSRGIIVAQSSWEYEGRPGRLIETPAYAIYTTEPDGLVTDRLPSFLEAALAHYRTALGPLPAPSRQLETYLLSNRPQWTRLTQRLMGPRAEPYLLIQRGGFAADGRGVFWNIGAQSTFAIAAHEGWHQYTQTVFREPLPVWLEEGLATFMEGFRWGEADPLPDFLPWANIERFDTLRAAADSGRSLRPLHEVLAASPADLVRYAGDPALVWYSQVWALAHFLNEGDDGAHRDALRRLLADAVAGRVSQTVGAALGERSAAAVRLRRTGPEVLLAYFGDDLDELDRRYAAFVQRLVAVGARDMVAQGLSPVR